MLGTATNLKIVVIGDGAVGKTSLLSTWSTGKFPVDYVPTVFENKVVPMDINGTRQNVAIWDTAGQEDFDRIRALFYPDSDAFVIAFSAVDVNSAYNVKERWFPELQVYAAGTPFVVVATKTDMRDDPEALEALQAQGTSPITPEQGQALAKDVGAAAYFETSAWKNQGVAAPFVEAARLAAEFAAKKGRKKAGAKPDAPPTAPSAPAPAPAAGTTGAASSSSSRPASGRESEDKSCCATM